MPPPARKPTLYFYRKDGCHLCDDMARGLMAFKREWESAPVSGSARESREFEIIPRDIEADERWYRRYREYVPTLVMGRREICHYFLDKDELKAALACR